MATDPSPNQTLFLWYLLANGGGAFLADIRPKLERSRREELASAGLIAIEPCRRLRPSKRPTMASYVTLTDTGWKWSSEHLTNPLPTRSVAGTVILQSLLAHLKQFLDARQLSLGELFVEAAATCEAETSPPPREPQAAIIEQVLQAARELSGSDGARRIRLAPLRARLSHLSRSAIDRELLRMEHSGVLVLYPLDDPQELGDDDRRAALPNSIGQARHIAYFGT